MKTVDELSVNEYGAVKTIIERIKIAMLATLDSDGTLRSHPITTRAFGDDGTLLFLTSRKSAKLHEAFANCGIVNLSYVDTRHQDYVSISGVAQVIEDREKLLSVWQPLDDIWFPQGLGDPDATLFNVIVNKAEYWSSGNFAVVRTLGTNTALRSGDVTSMGQNARMVFLGKDNARVVRSEAEQRRRQ